MSNIKHNYKNNINSNNSFNNKFLMPTDKFFKFLKDSWKESSVFNVLEGTIRSAKSTDLCVIGAGHIEESDDRLFAVIADNQPLAKSIFFDGDGLGLAHYPDWQERIEIVDGKRVKFRQRIFETKYKGKDALVLLPKKDSGKPVKFIVAYAGATISSHTSFKGESFGMVFATQWELLHQNTRDTMLGRIVSSSHKKVFIDLNPISPKAKIYEEMDEWEKNGLLNYMHKTMWDNPSMTERKINEAKMMHPVDSVIYQRDILGKRVEATGLIYKINDYNIINDSINPYDYSRYAIIADIGESKSATAFGLVALRKGGKGVDILKEYWHRNIDINKRGSRKSMRDYVLDFDNFIMECRELMGFPPYVIAADHHTLFHDEYERLRPQLKYGRILNNVKKDKIDYRIRKGEELIYQERLRFHFTCKNTIESFKVAQYDQKEQDKGNLVRYDNPSDDTRIDLIDMVEYGFKEFELELDRFRE